jgi:hypothetical protein
VISTLGLHLGHAVPVLAFLFVWCMFCDQFLLLIVIIDLRPAERSISTIWF